MYSSSLTLIVVILLSVGSGNAALISVTYEGFGTFTLTDFYDIKVRPFVLLPESPDDMNGKFLLFTRKNLNDSYHLDWKSNENYNQSYFDPKLDTKFIVHGWNCDENTSWLHKLKDAFLNKQNFNVIIAAWPGGANTGYVQAVSNTRIFGIMIGKVIENLLENYNISKDSIHLLGHSLGGHVVGYAGKYLNGEIGRITGLDPAGPFFEGLPYVEGRLWHTDAKFVDVIHTDAQKLINLGFGMNETCGHVDVFPNGGATQPGCDQEAQEEVEFEGGILEKLRFTQCNHRRAYEFITEAISPPVSDPIARMCNSYELFEQNDCNDENQSTITINPLVRSYENVDKSYSQGKRYYIDTADQSPFFR